MSWVYHTIGSPPKDARLSRLNEWLADQLQPGLGVGRGPDDRPGKAALLQSVAVTFAQNGALAEGVTVDRATDVLWAMSAAHTYGLLVTERGWSPEQYEEWLASSPIHSILDAIESRSEG